MKVAIVGGGICGLSLALNLKQRGIDCAVYERAPEIKELGVGITVLPHAMREFSALGIGDKLLAAGIENRESCFFNRFGQLIYKEPRGKFAGYQYPGSRHPPRQAAPDPVRDGDARRSAPTPSAPITSAPASSRTSAAPHYISSARRRAKRSRTSTPTWWWPATASIRCSASSSIPTTSVVFSGINTWRGVTRHKPILGGRTYMRVGSILTGKMVIYPIVDDIDGKGNQLINWMAEIKRDTTEANDWNKPGDLADFFPIYENWRFDWLDVAQMIRDADQILEYPMVDKDPIEQWTFGRITLAGDAAHPMYPRGSNGAAQAAIDARTLADFLRSSTDPREALKAYEAARSGPAARVVRTNREHPPDFINIKVEELVGDKPFDDLDKYITQDELRALSENYKRIAGFALADVGRTR